MNQPLKLSDRDVQLWAIGHPRSTPAQLSRAYGISYELLEEVLDLWMDNSDKTIANLAAEICVQNYIRAKRNSEKVDILVLCKAIEKLRDNLFSNKFGVSLRANRILGGVLDEYSQRKITVNIVVNKDVLEAIAKAAEMDGDTIIDITPENGGNEGEGEARPLLLGYKDSGVQENDGQRICSAQEIGGEMPGTEKKTDTPVACPKRFLQNKPFKYRS